MSVIGLLIAVTVLNKSAYRCNLVDEPMPADGEQVMVTGTIRPFNATELEQDYGFNWEQQLPRELETEYSQQVVLIVDRIQPANFDASEPELDLERNLVP